MTRSKPSQTLIFGSGGFMTDLRKNLATFRRHMVRRSVPIQTKELVAKLKVVNPQYDITGKPIKELKLAISDGITALYDGYKNMAKVPRDAIMEIANNVADRIDNAPADTLNEAIRGLTSDVEHGLRRDPKRQARKDKGSHKPGWAERQEEKANRPRKPPTKYNKFVSVKSKLPEMKGLSFAERSKKISELWQKEKSKRKSSNDDNVDTQPKVARRKTKRAVTAVPKYGKGMTIEGGRWQDYIPPEVKSMAMKQARKFTGKGIASDDLFGSGMYRD